MIITLTQFKGGVGKTTSAICLSALLSAHGKTLLIDSDPNRSASLWCRKDTMPFECCDDSVAPKKLMKGGFDHVVIDTPARPAQDEIESLAEGCDLLILPSTPDPLALSALAQIASALPEGVNYKCLLTMTPPPPQRDAEEARVALSNAGLPLFEKDIRRYKEYIKAADECRVVKGVAWHDWQAVEKELLIHG